MPIPDPMTSLRSVKEQQRAVNKTSISPKLKIDGIYGPKTYAGVKFLQRRAGTKDDGIWGPKTESAYKSYLKKQKRNREDSSSEDNSSDDKKNDSNKRSGSKGTLFDWFVTGG